MYMFAREKVDANGRRLVGAAQVIGLFNMLESAFEGAGLEDDAMPRMPGDQFELQVQPLLFHARKQFACGCHTSHYFHTARRTRTGDSLYSTKLFGGFAFAC